MNDNQYTRVNTGPNSPIVEDKLDETYDQLTDDELVKTINGIRTKLLKLGVDESVLIAQKAAALKEATNRQTIIVGEDGIATADADPPSLFSAATTN